MRRGALYVPFVLLAAAVSSVYAQGPTTTTPLPSSPSPSPTPTPSPSLSLSLTTASVTLTTRIAGQNQPLTTVSPTTFNVTRTITSTSSTHPTTSTSHTPTPSSNPYVLETTVDPAFVVLGAVLIVTGLSSTFWGHKNRWTSFFLIGFYTLSLVCFVLILKFGILAAVNPPSKSLRGLFVLSCTIAGVAGGAAAIFFWKAARYGIGAWGGFALALWLQCFRNGGLIRPIGLRWILYIGSSVSGFMLCTIPKIHYHTLLISTAIVGSSAFMLGVDCFTTAGLKEFYVWNLGFRSLFPKYTTRGIQFPVSQTMQIELGLIGAISLIGTAVQLRILSALHLKLDEIGLEQRRRDEEADSQAALRVAAAKRELTEWERQHPTLARHGRNASGISSVPLLYEKDGSVTPPITFARPRIDSDPSDFKAAPDEDRRTAKNPQSLRVLPALDLGLGIQDDVPNIFIASDEQRLKDGGEDLRKRDLTPRELEELKRKEELVLEIQNIRRSIEALKAETPLPVPSSSDASRRPSLRRTLSIDAHSALLPAPSHHRPPREMDPRQKAYSMDMSVLSPQVGESISRPTSTPLRDEGWDNYVHERKLMQPPVGITPPIPTTSTPAARISVAPAVTEALNQRKQRENAISHLETSSDSSDDIPLSRVARHARSYSARRKEASPVRILPPRRESGIVAPTPQRASTTRIRTFEELNERHREKLRDLQAPLTQAEQEEADVRAARQRWERNMALEKEAVTRRQAEKAAQVERRKKKEERQVNRSRTLSPDRRYSRSLSHDKLAALGSTAKRLSTMKVEDWQKYQQDLEIGERGGPSPSSPSGVPFSDTRKHRSWRMSKDHPS